MYELTIRKIGSEEESSFDIEEDLAKSIGKLWKEGKRIQINFLNASVFIDLSKVEVMVIRKMED